MQRAHCVVSHLSLQTPVMTLELSVRDFQAELTAALGATPIEVPGMIEVRNFTLTRHTVRVFCQSGVDMLVSSYRHVSPYQIAVVRRKPKVERVIRFYAYWPAVRLLAGCAHIF